MNIRSGIVAGESVMVCIDEGDGSGTIIYANHIDASDPPTQKNY